MAPSTLGYVAKLPAKDAPVAEATRTLAGQYPRYGYRRIRMFLARHGHQVGAGRSLRLWHMASLQVPRKRPVVASALPVHVLRLTCPQLPYQ